MISVSKRAAVELQRMREARHLPADRAVRLVPDGAGSFQMALDAPREQDVVLREGDAPLLLVDPNVAGHASGLVLHYRSADEERVPTSGFVLLRKRTLEAAADGAPGA